VKRMRLPCHPRRSGCVPLEKDFGPLPYQPDGHPARLVDGDQLLTTLARPTAPSAASDVRIGPILAFAETRLSPMTRLSLSAARAADPRICDLARDRQGRPVSLRAKIHSAWRCSRPPTRDRERVYDLAGRSVSAFRSDSHLSTPWDPVDFPRTDLQSAKQRAEVPSQYVGPAMRPGFDELDQRGD